MHQEHTDRLLTKLSRELGPVICAALQDQQVIEVMVNPDGRVWVERLGAGKQVEGYLSPSQSMSVVSTVAAMLGTVVTHEKPSLEGELPLDQSRFTAVTPPIVAAAIFTIRKKAVKIFTLADYLARGIISQEQHDFLCAATKGHRNIIVVGGTGSGKTTLLNALIESISTQTPEDRLVIIEDTGELQCSAADAVTMRSASHFTMNQCLKTTMRLRPERIIVGEVRGGEAMALLKAWNTGHEGGAGTVHANSARLGLSRIQSLIAEAPEASNYTPDMIQKLIAEAVNVVVFIRKNKEASSGRTVEEIIAIEGFDSGSGDYRIRNVC